MADYISTLTGSQMDSALLDMAEHNSEAFAVGERNGVPVNNGDVTYHNNARYYAQQAQSIAPASVTEAVRWDVAQTALTDANKAQARANIDAGENGAWSNRNLLDNAYFVGGGSQWGYGTFPINQRGQAQYTAVGFIFDRWFKSGGVTVDLASDGVTITNGNGWPDGINQRFPTYYFSQFNGKPLTVSALLSDGTIVSGTVTVDASQNYQWVKYPEANEIGFQLKNFQYGATYDYFDYISIAVGAGGNAIKVRAVKIELGTVSTLANDTPPDFGEELQKCQKYLFVHKFAAYDVVGNGYAASTTVGGFSICLPVSMRTGGNPQATYTALPSAYGGGSASNLSTMNLASLIGNIARYYVEFSGIPANNSICVMATTDTTITISNEL